jgi:SAM-dependent methyltransferase
MQQFDKAKAYTDRLRKRYSGDGAKRYVASRAKNARWDREQAWFGGHIARFQGASFLDAPVGTGRFVSEVKAADGQLIAVDISADMLAQAREAAHEAGLKSARFLESDMSSVELPEDVMADVAISARFFNWLPSALASNAFANIAAHTRSEMLVSLTSIDERHFSGTELAQVQNRLSRSHDVVAGDDRAPNGPHSFTAFLDWTEQAGFELVETELLAEGQSNLRVELHRLVRKAAL